MHFCTALGNEGCYSIIDTLLVVKSFVHPPLHWRTQLQIINDKQFMHLIWKKLFQIWMPTWKLIISTRNKTVVNELTYFIPQDVVIYDDKDGPRFRN